MLQLLDCNFHECWATHEERPVDAAVRTLADLLCHANAVVCDDPLLEFGTVWLIPADRLTGCAIGRLMVTGRFS